MVASKAFERILIIMFENQYRGYVLQNPFMRKLAAAGADMSNYFGVFHPSQTNYLASLAGEVCGVSNDDPPAHPLAQLTLIDLLEPAGITWKAYMEGYPEEPWNPAWVSSDYDSSKQPINEYPTRGPSLAGYFRKHNAFASFHGIQARRERWERIVDDRAFWVDVEAKALPDYAWFTPDIWNDGHYLYNTHIDTNPRTQLVPQISTWLEYVMLGKIESGDLQGGSAAGPDVLGLNIDVDRLLTDPARAWAESCVPPGTLIVITFDEADFNAIGYDTSYEGPNQVYTVLLGDMIIPGTIISTPYNHYSLIKTIERNFGCGDLGKNDRDANAFRFLWKESFAWTVPADTGLSTDGPIALSNVDAVPVLVFEGANGEAQVTRFESAKWRKATGIGFESAGGLALACIDQELTLVFTDQTGEMFHASCGPDGKWCPPKALGHRTSGSIALTAYRGGADDEDKLMLCWQSELGFIEYLIRENGEWQTTPGSVGQLTDGPMAIAQLGPSLYLVYKERNTRMMRFTSFNLAPFNAFDAVDFQGHPAPVNSTGLHNWSPADYPVGNFAKKMAALGNRYEALGMLAMASIEGEMHLVHRGAYPDTPGALTEFFGLTGILTATHPMTNGYGTIDQAGWTAEQPLPGIELDPESPVAMSSDGQRLMLVWQASGTKCLRFCTGEYQPRK